MATFIKYLDFYHRSTDRQAQETNWLNWSVIFRIYLVLVRFWVNGGLGKIEKMPGFWYGISSGGLAKRNRSGPNRIPTVKLKIPGKPFLKSESRNSVTFKL